MKLIVCVCLLLSATSMLAQTTPQQVMEGRASEFQKAINMNDREAWKKFIRENYSKSFIDKAPSRRVVVDGEEQGSTKPQADGTDKTEAKADLLEMLHNDFGGSKLISLDYKDYVIDMVLKSNEGLMGTFRLTFQKNKPYLIDNMGVEASMNR